MLDRIKNDTTALLFKLIYDDKQNENLKLISLFDATSTLKNLGLEELTIDLNAVKNCAVAFTKSGLLPLSLLGVAAEAENLTAIKKLLESGMNINDLTQDDKNIYPALFIAIGYKNHEITKFFLLHMANPNITCNVFSEIEEDIREWNIVNAKYITKKVKKNVTTPLHICDIKTNEKIKNLLLAYTNLRLAMDSTVTKAIAYFTQALDADIDFVGEFVNKMVEITINNHNKKLHEKDNPFDNPGFLRLVIHTLSTIISIDNQFFTDENRKNVLKSLQGKAIQDLLAYDCDYVMEDVAVLFHDKKEKMRILNPLIENSSYANTVKVMKEEKTAAALIPSMNSPVFGSQNQTEMEASEKAEVKNVI